MAWETRKGKGLYYCRSRRVDGRVQREYVGIGPAAEFAASEDERRRELRELDRARRKKEREELSDIAQTLKAVAAFSAVSMKAGLVAMGYHRHHGQWRKRRNPEEELMEEGQSLAKPPQDLQDVREALETFRKGGPGASQTLVELIKDRPDLVILYGDVAHIAEEKLLLLSGGGDFINLETRRMWLKDVRRNLTNPGDGELERQLIHRYSLNLLAVNLAEAGRATREREDITWSDLHAWDRHVSTLQSDLLRAARALQEVRRLGRPTIVAQTNIGGQQQINIGVANPSGSEEEPPSAGRQRRSRKESQAQLGSGTPPRKAVAAAGASLEQQVICHRCARRANVYSCEAFPNRIPDDILYGGFDHHAPHDGDNGLVFVELPAEEDEEES